MRGAGVSCFLGCGRVNPGVTARKSFRFGVDGVGVPHEITVIADIRT